MGQQEVLTVHAFSVLSWYSHNTSTIDGANGITPFFLMFGRNATSPETVALQLPNQPIDKNDYAKPSSEDHRSP